MGAVPAGAARPAPTSARALSLRRYLLLGILLPVGLFVVINTWSLYRQAQVAATTAYDRTLLASAKSISEQLDVEGYDDDARLRARVPYSALEAFEADNQSRIYYKVSNLAGELVSGYTALPRWQGRIPDKPAYAALVDFYDDTYLGEPVRVAALLQPVTGTGGRAMAVIQVAETLELRHTLARQMLLDTLWRQALLVGVIALVVVVVVQRATRPVRKLSAELQARPEGDLTPIDAPDAPRELLPLVDATNAVMNRLEHLLAHQKRFVRDASHQLRTPLAVLKTQVQSALRGDVEPRQALEEINETVDRATALANQMLALAKVEQLRQQTGEGVRDLGRCGPRGGARPIAPHRRQGHRLHDRDHAGSGRRAPVDAAGTGPQPPAQRDQAHPGRRAAGGARGGRLAHRRTHRRRQRTGNRQRNGGTPVPALLRGRRTPRIGAGTGHLPGNRRSARRQHQPGEPDRARAHGRPGCHGATAKGQRPGAQSALMEKLRIDKWLWAARFYKTRSLAVEEIGRGRVQVNGQDAKPSREVKSGDTVALQQGPVRRTVIVRGISGMRGPAPVAQALYEETADSVVERERAAEQRRLAPEPALGIAHGRPTKRDRRDIGKAWGDRWSASIDD
jgi:ribosomal 50S subunit-recycling heat shock protein